MVLDGEVLKKEKRKRRKMRACWLTSTPRKICCRALRKKKGLEILETLRRKRLIQLRWKTRNRKTSGTSTTLRRRKLRMLANKNLHWRLAQVKNQRLSKRTMTSATLVDSRDSPSKMNLRRRVMMTGQMTSRKRSLSPRVRRKSPSQTSKATISGTLALTTPRPRFLMRRKRKPNLKSLKMAALGTSMKPQSLNKSPKTNSVPL